MKVIAGELGDRPSVLTRARRFAPEGLRVLADLLGRLDFADTASVVLDWENVLGRQPDEVAIPVIIAQVSKRVTSVTSPNNVLTIEVRLDVEDLFGNDAITANHLVDIVQGMREKMDSSIAQRVHH